MEVDFAGDKIEWVDCDGVTRQSKLFTEAFEDEIQTDRSMAWSML